MLASTISADAQQDIFVFVQDVPGESHDIRYPNWIEVSSFSHGVNHPVTNQVTPPTHQAINIVKYLDKSSPILSAFCAAGTNIPLVKMEFVKGAVDGQLRYYQLSLSNVVVTAVQNSGVAGGDQPVESISFQYDRIDWTYTEFDDRGRPKQDYVAFWNQRTQSGSGGGITPPPDNDGDGIPDSTDPDDDNDGMTDVYELANGLNKNVNDAAGDLDGDGMSNYREFMAGTSANNANSFFKVSKVALEGGGARLTWTSIAGKNYSVMSSASVTGPYNFVKLVASAGNGETSTVIPNSQAKEFFIIKVQ